MTWKVAFHPAFAEEFGDLAEAVQDELAAMIRLLQAMGPHLKRPGADTAGDKSGGSQKRFYKALIARADERFDEHLAALKAARRKR